MIHPKLTFKPLMNLTLQVFLDTCLEKYANPSNKYFRKYVKYSVKVEGKEAKNIHEILSCFLSY